METFKEYSRLGEFHLRLLAHAEQNQVCRKPAAVGARHTADNDNSTGLSWIFHLDSFAQLQEVLPLVVLFHGILASNSASPQ